MTETPEGYIIQDLDKEIDQLRQAPAFPLERGHATS